MEGAKFGSLFISKFTGMFLTNYSKSSGSWFCYHCSNKKADVISLTSIQLVSELLYLLSGISEVSIASYFKRSLSARGNGHKASVIVSEVKDIYLQDKAGKNKIKQGRLRMTIAFHNEEWNVYGFPPAQLN